MASAPTNTSQRAFVNLVFLIGLLLQASVVGSAASLVLQFDQHRSTFNEQMDRQREARREVSRQLDVNSATVTEYKQLKGLYPAVAGKVASHGPYASISDVYKLADFSPAEAKLFKQHQGDFTVLPPGRMFIERINQRQSL